MDTLIKKHDRWWDITPTEIVRQWAQSMGDSNPSGLLFLFVQNEQK